MTPLRGLIVPALALLVLPAIGVRARADDCPPKDAACWQVRMAVAKHGQRQVEDRAKACGWTHAEISTARRCLPSRQFHRRASRIACSRAGSWMNRSHEALKAVIASPMLSA